jgi:hypothetical protein
MTSAIGMKLLVMVGGYGRSGVLSLGDGTISFHEAIQPFKPLRHTHQIFSDQRIMLSHQP